MTGSPPDLKSKSGKWAGEPDFSTGARFTLWPNFFFKCFSDWCIRCLCLCICLFLYQCICVCSQGNLSDSRCILSVCLAFNCHLQPHPLALIHCSNPHFSPCCWSNPHFSHTIYYLSSKWLEMTPCPHTQLPAHRFIYARHPELEHSYDWNSTLANQLPISKI